MTDPQPSPQPGLPHPPQATNNVDPKQMVQFVTTIKNAEQQVGEHIIRALQHPKTVAVVTTVRTARPASSGSLANKRSRQRAKRELLCQPR